MQRHTFNRSALYAIEVLAAAFFCSACSTPQKISSDRLTSIGVNVGTMYWLAEQKLAGEGYRCFVSGQKRENFDCTKSEGFFPTCLMRITFNVDEKNAISNVRVADAACIGTP